MSMTKIEWTDKTYNPITGCTPVSEGCRNCYARRMAKRLAGRCGYPADDPFRVTIHQNRIAEPLRWKKPKHFFVCSMSDLFHEDVPFDVIDRIFAVMALTPQHTYQVLTKRPERMLKFFAEWSALPNVWLGVSAENQKAADERIPLLLKCPAAVRFVSAEPMLGPVDLYFGDNMTPDEDSGVGCTPCDFGGKRHQHYIGEPCGRWIDWVIVGCETGPGAWTMELNWARALRDQCVAARVPFFFKRGSDGSRLLDGREWNEKPTRKGTPCQR